MEDEVARAGLEARATFPAPADDFVEQVFCHGLTEQGASHVSASIVNPGFAQTDGIGLTVSWDPRQLPRMWQWRMLGPGMYLTGMEPANCGILGRAEEREMGSLQSLAPGEKRAFDVTIRVGLGPEVGALIESSAGVA